VYNEENCGGDVKAETPSAAAKNAHEDQAASERRDKTQLSTADADLLNELVDMGFVEVRARKALMSGIAELEPAVLWISEHAEDSDIDDEISVVASSSDEGAEARGLKPRQKQKLRPSKLKSLQNRSRTPFWLRLLWADRILNRILRCR
jgi:uncharacterized UBP type Zn finger protein